MRAWRAAMVVAALAAGAGCGWFGDEDVLSPVDVSGGIGYRGGGCLGDSVYPPVESSKVFLRATVDDFAEPVALVPVGALSRALNPDLDEEIRRMLFGDEDAVGVISDGLTFEGRDLFEYEQAELLLARLGLWQELDDFDADAEVLVAQLGFSVPVPNGSVPPLGGRTVEFINGFFVRDGDQVEVLGCEATTTLDYLDFIADHHDTTPWLALVGLTTGAYEAIDEPPAPRLVPFGQRGPLGRTFADSDKPQGVDDRLIELTVEISGAVPVNKVVCARGDRAIASCRGLGDDSFVALVEANHDVELFVVVPFLRDQAEVEALDTEARNAVAEEYRQAMNRRVIGPTFFLERGRDPWTVSVEATVDGQLRLIDGPTR